MGKRDGLTFTETSAYLEQPIGGASSVVVAPWFEQNFDTTDGWRAESTVGLKFVVSEGSGWTLAAQPSALWVSHPPVSCSEGGGELRVLGGRNLSSAAFLNVEGAARTLEGGCSAVRVDVTAGYRAGENWLALGQVFFEGLEGSGDSVKAQLTLVRFGSRGRALQLGLRARIASDDLEPTLVLGTWGRSRE